VAAKPTIATPLVGALARVERKVALVLGDTIYYHYYSMIHKMAGKLPAITTLI